MFSYPLCRKSLMLLFLTVVFQQQVFSQSPQKTGSWTMFFGQLRFHDKWSLHAEAQYRDHGIFDEPEQILLRSGINFHYNSLSSLSAGYGRITNYADDNAFLESPVVSENRLWQQFLMKNKLDRCLFEHRYRVEQRWLESNSNKRYLNRIRYLLRATIPINKKEIEKNTLFLSFYNEVFIHLSPETFDRNRLYGAFGYQFSPNANFQLGYLAQTVNRATKHHLQAAVFYNIDLRKKE